MIKNILHSFLFFLALAPALSFAEFYATPSELGSIFQRCYFDLAAKNILGTYESKGGKIGGLFSNYGITMKYVYQGQYKVAYKALSFDYDLKTGQVDLKVTKADNQKIEYSMNFRPYYHIEKRWREGDYLVMDTNYSLSEKEYFFTTGDSYSPLKQGNLYQDTALNLRKAGRCIEDFFLLN